MELNTYPANAFGPDSGPTTLRGVVALHPDHIRFEGNGRDVELPISGIRVRVGGHNNEQIFFEHPDRPGWSVYSNAEMLLNDPVWVQRPELMEEIRRARKQIGSFKPVFVVLGIFAALVVFALALLLAIKDPVVGWIANRVPPSWEQNLGEALMTQVTAGRTVLAEGALQARVEEVGRRLVAAVPNPEHPFRFYVLQDTNVNAFALPGGHIVIHTGLLESVSRTDELAGVMAHEIAHVTHKHGLRKMIDAAGLALLVQALFGDVSGLMAWIVDSSEFLLRQKYSRDFERQADDAGWEYMVAAGYDPRGLIEFFEKLNQQEGARPPALLNTHPATEERIQRLESKLNRP